jgi:hypothetical protein
MTAPSAFWLRPAASRLDAQRRSIVGRPSVKIVPSWKKEKAA